MGRLDNVELHLVRDFADVERFMEWLGRRRPFLAVDVETTGLNAGRDYIRLCQFGDATQGWALDYRDWRGVCKQAIETYEGQIVCHNLLYDSKMLKADGVVIPQHLAHDSMVMAFLKDSAAGMDLKGSAARYVDRRARMGQGLLKAAMSAQGWGWADIPVEAPAYWIYSAMDTSLTAMLAEKLWNDTAGGPYREAYELELAVIHCLREAELAGMLTDPDYIDRASRMLEMEIATLEAQIPCKPSSDKEVLQLLQSLGANLFVRTDKGNLSVDKHVLKYVAKHDGLPVAALISEWRSKDRNLNSYLRKFSDLGVQDVLRASTRPVAARTGRMSVTDPPLQTLPRGRLVRDAIVARPGHRLLLADFKNMEMRALASLAHEKNMLEAFDRGEDLHDFVAQAVFGDGFTKPQRSTAKSAAFAKVYGAGLEQFAATAGIGLTEAKDFLDRYDQLFPGVAQFMQATTNEVMHTAGSRRKRGWVELVDGRRLMVEGDKAYVGTNYKIQGGCAVSTKRKIVELDAAGMGPFFRLAVHDELINEVPHEHIDEARHIMEQVMPDRDSFPGTVLEVDTDVVGRWGEHYRHDYEAYVPTAEPDWMTEEAA